MPRFLLFLVLLVPLASCAPPSQEQKKSIGKPAKTTKKSPAASPGPAPTPGPAPGTAPGPGGGSVHTPPDVLEDASLSSPKLLRKYGYPVENHVVMTEDGYVLTLHRVPRGSKFASDDDGQIKNNRVRSLRQRQSNRTERGFSDDGFDGDKGRGKARQVVLLVPGMMCSSAIFLVMGPQRSLGYILADAGYDVWIANPRGVRYSLGHVEIPPTDVKYWQFSWHEMGQFDMPAVLDYVTGVTGQEKVPVVGHSMGNTMMMVMGSVRPEYNRKVSLHVAMAPTVYMQHAQSPVLRGLAALVPTVSALTDILGMHSIRPTPPLNEALTQMCREEAVVTQRICKNSVFMLLGFDPQQLNETMFPVIMGHFPSGGSTRILLHYMQSYTKGDFRQYDMGPKRNLQRYGQTVPPAYNISRVDFPIALLVGENDWVDAMEDVERMAKQLPNVVDFYRVPWPKFNHMDHVFAIDGKALEYNHILDILRKFS